MTQLTSFNAANLSTKSFNELHFPNDTRSMRAQKAAKMSFDLNSTKIKSETLFQIVTLENMSQSKASQLDELLYLNDLESVGSDRLRFSNQKVIRAVEVDEDDNGNQNPSYEPTKSNTNSFFKITLQDSFNNLAYAIEIEKLPFLSGKNQKSGFPIHLGSKLMINNASVVDGVIFLTRDNCEFLGGIVREWNSSDLNTKHISYLQEELKKLKE